MKKCIFLLFVFLTLTGCSTPYVDGNKPFSIAGGYGSEPVTSGITKVYFSANGYTDVTLAYKYALRRAAEIGKKQNSPYFAVYLTLSDAANDHKSTRAMMDVTFNKPMAYFYVSYHQKKEPDDFVVADILSQYS